MNDGDTTLKSYYRERAPFYDQVYDYPERQADLRYLERYIPQQFTGLDVLEIAAGTGYWTQFIITEATSILATDATGEALEQIAQRPLPRPVPTKIIDAYTLHDIPRQYSGAFAGLWLSHVPKQRLHEFLGSLHQCLKPGAAVLFIDNSDAQCARLPLSGMDEHGNTYQDRELEDGTVYRVLKNFPSEEELISATGGFGSNHKYLALENFWLFQYVAR